MKLTFKHTSIDSLKIFKRDKFQNNVGSFERIFCEEQFKNIGLDKKIVQINKTRTEVKGSVRGLHYQTPPFSENKIITCIKGKVFDVAIDIRKNSDTFLKWHGEVLSEDNQTSIFIPEGFAHGFQTLTDDCEMLYFHTAFYNIASERGIIYNDKNIAIDWPLETINLSNKDINLPKINDGFNGIEL